MTGADSPLAAIRENEVTLRSYGISVERYVEGTGQTVHGVVKEWIDRAIFGLPREAAIFEIGSAFGRDAAYLASAGYSVACSDAVPEFVDELRSRGFDARPFDITRDAFDRRFNMILANAVLLHFPASTIPALLRKARLALESKGRFAFSLKAGEGDGWSSEKIGRPRYFCFWRADRLEPLLAEAGFDHWSIDSVVTDRTHTEWLLVIAHAA